METEPRPSWSMTTAGPLACGTAKRSYSIWPAESCVKGIEKSHYQWSGAAQATVAARSRSLKRWILPVAVLGKAAENWIQRGYLYGARRDFTHCFSSLASESVGSNPVLSTIK